MEKSHQPRSFREQVNALLEHTYVEFFMTAVTMIVLYTSDIVTAALPSSVDTYYHDLMLVCFCIFGLEVLLLSFVRDGYFPNFFFWMDTISTLTLVLEIPLLLGPLGLDFSVNKRTTSFTSVSRASRLSARVARVVRVIRVLRVARLYKYAARRIEIRKKLQQNLQRHSHKVPTPVAPPTHTSHQESLFTEQGGSKSKLTLYSRHLIPDNEQTHNVTSGATQGRMSAIKSGRFITLQRKSVQFRHSGAPISESSSSSSSSSSEDEQDTKVTLDKSDGPPETNVGKAIQASTTKKSIIIMFAMVFSVPLFDYATFFTFPDAYNNSLTLLESLNNKQATTSYMDFVDSEDPLNRLVYLQVSNHTYRNESIEDLRSLDMGFYFSSTSDSQSIIDNHKSTQLNSIFGIAQTSFLILCVIVTSHFFGGDIQDLVVTPLEEMMYRINQISKDPLEARYLEEEFELAEEGNKDTGHHTYECDILKKLIVKTGALLALGFGEAGTQVIKRNLKSSNIDPMIAGVRIVAVFGFCDIRNFTDTTEILQEQVMKFVNEIAQIVHSTVTSFYGSPNKNIGDAFLLVWKFQPDWVELDKFNNINIHHKRLVNNMADMSILAFAQIIAKIRKSRNLMEYALPVQSIIPKYQVRLGIGVHVGWAIEGPIGSRFKIEASYLSPNVNICGTLEEQTKTYGALILLSGQLYKLLSRPVQEKIRYIDKVLFKGQSDVIDVLSFDLNISMITQGTSVANHHHHNPKIARYMQRKRIQKRFDRIKANKLNINQLLLGDTDLKIMTMPYTDEFRQLYHDALNHYLDGRWVKAKICFQSAQDSIESKQDGACQFLLDFMSRTKFQSPYNWKGFRDEVKS